jgi:hypothetical protein
MTPRLVRLRVSITISVLPNETSLLSILCLCCQQEGDKFHVSILILRLLSSSTVATEVAPRKISPEKIGMDDYHRTVWDRSSDEVKSRILSKGPGYSVTDWRVNFERRGGMSYGLWLKPHLGISPTDGANSRALLLRQICSL